MDQPSSTESNALTLRIRFKSASLDEFIGRYAVDVSPGGIFIRTKQPVEVGTSLQFDFMLADGTSLLAGLGTVAWVRENDPARANNVPGMGLRFDKLTVESQQTHQRILAEKARKEGKSQGTPYPPTSFIVPPSRPSPAPESSRITAESPLPPEMVPDPLANQQVSPANFAKTLPAPAAALAARMQVGTEESGEFDGGGKTEISEKPIEEIMREAERAAGRDFAPKSMLDDSKTDAHDLQDEGAPPAPEEVAVSDSQAYATEAPVPPPSAVASGERPLGDSGERGQSGNRAFASLLDLGDTGENFTNEPTASNEPPDSAVPVELSAPEKTEEVSLSNAKMSSESIEPIDLIPTPSEGPDEQIDHVPSLAEIEASTVAPKAKRSGALAIIGIVLAAAAAFAAVYLLQTKPWETPGNVESTVAVKPTPPPTPAPAPAPAPTPAPTEKQAAPAAQEPKPAATEEPAPAAAKKAAEEKPAPTPPAEKPAAVVEKPTAPEKPAAPTPPVEKPAPPAEKPVAVAKVEPEKPAKPTSAKPATKTGKPGPESAGAEKPAATSGADEEEVHRLAFRSSPMGAEVLLDGEYYARTPCERRILDPKKTISITVRKEGYEPFEHMVGASDNWVKKGNERVLSISVSLKKIPKAAPPEQGAAGEAKPAPKPAPDDEPVKE